MHIQLSYALLSSVQLYSIDTQCNYKVLLGDLVAVQGISSTNHRILQCCHRIMTSQMLNCFSQVFNKTNHYHHAKP